MVILAGTQRTLEETYEKCRDTTFSNTIMGLSSKGEDCRLEIAVVSTFGHASTYPPSQAYMEKLSYILEKPDFSNHTMAAVIKEVWV